MLHITKLAVGVQDIEHLKRAQAARVANNGFAQVTTRNFPKRSEEILNGGSLYWVIKGVMVCRQKILEFKSGQYTDGSKCTIFVLDKEIVPLVARKTKAFQGWRYLEESDAPSDFKTGQDSTGIDELPEAMRRELQQLGLI